MSLADQIAAAAAASGDSTAPPQSLADQIAAAAAAQQPPTATAAAAYSPLGSTYENIAAGAGKAVADMGRGAGGLLRSGLERIGGGAMANAAGLPTVADVDESKRRDAALMGTKAGVAGNIGGNIAMTMLPFGGAARLGVPGAAAMLNPSTYTAAAGAGALSGLLQPVGTGDSRLLNTGVGALSGLAGNAAVNTIGRIAQPVANALSGPGQRAVQVLQGAGVPLDAAQLTGSSTLSRLRSSFSDNPFTSGAQAEAHGVQQGAFTRAILGTIGEPTAQGATTDVMGNASRRINGVFGDILSRNNVQITDPMLGRIATVQQAANDEEKGAVSNIANRLLSNVQADGTVPGQIAYNVKKDLDRLASSSDTTLAYHARQLRSTVMDGINDSLPPADQAAFQLARQQFRNMKTIEPAIDKAGSGNINPATLANVMKQKANRQASIYGNGDQELADLAKAGNMLLGDKMPNSGTAARAAMQLALPLTAGMASGASDAYHGDYGSAASKAALGFGTMYAAPRAAQALINNPGTAAYLARGMAGPMVPLRSVLLAPQTNDVVGGVTRRLAADAFQPRAIQSVPAQ